MNKYLETVKQEALIYYESGVRVSEIAKTLSISKSTVYKWIKEWSNAVPNNSIAYLKRLENKVKRLERIVEILQSVDCTANSPLSEKLAALE